MYFITVNTGIICICNLATLILHTIRVDFVENTGNIFSGSIRTVISKYFGCFNSINMKKYEYKIVIE